MSFPLLMAVIWVITIFTLYVGIFWFLLFLESRQKISAVPKAKKFPRFSIIVPAFNEADNIAKCIHSLAQLDYPKRPEVIVVNDGSTDGTERIAAEAAKGTAGKVKVRIINQQNRGKGTALNAGLRVAKGDIIAVMDADSTVERDALLRSIGYFEDEKVAAVVSSIKPLEKKNFMEKIQSSEYMISCLYRRLGSLASMVYVIPGAFSLYRRSALEHVGGFDEKNITEDMEIALRLVEHGYLIRNSMTSVAYTKLPHTFMGFYRQRMRWYRGLVRNIWNYRHMLFNRRYGYLGTFQLPMNIIFPVISLIVAVLAFYVGFTSLYQALLELKVLGLNLNFSFEKWLVGFDWRIMVPWLAVFAFGIVVMTASYRALRESVKNTIGRPVALVFLLVFYTLINILWFIALVKEAKGEEAKW